MSDDLDLEQLGGIGDPFAQEASAPARPMDREALPERVRRAPTRARARAGRWIALAAALAFDASWLIFHERRPDLPELPPSQVAMALLVPLVAGGLALAAAMRKGSLGLGLPARRVGLAVAAALALFVAGTLVTAPEGGPDPLFWKHAAACLGVTILLAIGPIVFALGALRHAFPAASRWRTAAVGAACGGLSTATMSLACSISAPAHVLLGHGAILLVGALAGALLAPAVARS